MRTETSGDLIGYKVAVWAYVKTVWRQRETNYVDQQTQTLKPDDDWFLTLICKVAFVNFLLNQHDDDDDASSTSLDV